MSSRLLQVIALLLLLCGACSGALQAAECSSTTGAADFGTSDSYTVYTTSLTTTASAGFSCDASSLSFITTNYIQLTLSSSANGSGTQPQMYGEGYYIPYNVYVDSEYSEEVAVGDSYVWSITSLLGLAGLFNSSDDTLPLYLATSTGSNVPAGTYTDTLTLTWYYYLCDVGLHCCAAVCVQHGQWCVAGALYAQ
jgi:spore coat protein U-like protein